MQGFCCLASPLSTFHLCTAGEYRLGEDLVLRVVGSGMECCGNQGMRTNRHLLILGAFALKSLVLSDRTVVDIIVDSVAISNLIMTEGHDACVRPGLLASSEGLIECEDALDLDTFGSFAPEFCCGDPLMHLQQLIIPAD